MRIGIFGGTFDPIHFAHLHCIAYAMENAELDICHVVVAGDPWQKPDIKVDAKSRFSWVQSAVSEYFPNDENIIIDDREMLRQGQSYTIDTLMSFKEQYEDSEFVLIVGDDVPDNFHTWKDHDRISELAEMFIIPRSIMPISSTYIRQLIAGNKTIRGLVPYTIESEIIEARSTQ